MSRVVHFVVPAPPVLAWCDGDPAASLLTCPSTARIWLVLPISEKQCPVSTGQPARSASWAAVRGGRGPSSYRALPCGRVEPPRVAACALANS